MQCSRFTLFDTPIGRCGIGWSDRGVASVALPETSDEAIRARLLERRAGAIESAPPTSITRAIDAIVGLLGAEDRSLDFVELDLDAVPPFHRRVYEVARAIPRGRTLSYGEVATRAGSPGAARAVGQALGKNPFGVVVPCHRVLASDGKPCGFSANGGITTKLRMLAAERAQPGSGLRYDPESALAHLRRDRVMRRLIRDVGDFSIELDQTGSVFAAITRSIVYQQLHGRAAATILGRVHELAKDPADGQLSPERLAAQSDDALRGAGLSGAKLLALRDLTARRLDGRLPELAALERMDDEAIIETLTEVRGVGRWTVEMFLLFTLGRPDVWPVADYGVRKGYAATFGLAAHPSTKELAELGASWAPFRSVASWYLWRAAERAL